MPLFHTRSFPIKAPEGALTRDDVSALSQLELCLNL
jgi:ribonucleoside-diphosphate reductase alpha chain